MKNYSVLAGYLQQLLKKDVAFQRNSSQHEDFVALKERLTTVCILAYSSFIRCIPTLAKDSIGFNLTQIQNCLVRAIVYGGRNFSDNDKKNSVTELKALSVIVEIETCRPYLLGNHFIVVVCHQALKWLMSLRDPIGRLGGWALTLQEYDFSIQCCPGKDHLNADALSRHVCTIYQ